MVKGTPSQGKRQKRSHIMCRRCGRVSYGIHAKYCVACGFGRSRRMRSYNWVEKKP
ncbi:MAG: 50S ribosomal protein L37e [Euryarchaeota archaeon]|nr:50S ribosomal protein L37e [Euryarchaeota archaeon]NAS88992.1 50S ribosomal protein L37e [ANME-1 cluster archaeon AG-394-G21]NAT10423.1 50S ribosomal protein L37e [ANME-1 cluster archaeon AG-394-G06]